MQYLYAIMLIGYARVSTGEQTTAAQVAALKTSGCELIFRDNASGGRWDRPELHKLLSQLRKGDVLVVWTLDRLSRSLRDVLTIMERVQERHAGFRSLKEAVDTTTPAGRMMMQMVGAFAEFERAMLKERTKAGLDAARKEGRIGGRPPKLKPHQQQEIVTLVKQGKKTAADAARLFGVHPATVSRLLRRTWIESSTVLSVPLLPKPLFPQPRVTHPHPCLERGHLVADPELAGRTERQAEVNPCLGTAGAVAGDRIPGERNRGRPRPPRDSRARRRSFRNQNTQSKPRTMGCSP